MFLYLQNETTYRIKFGIVLKLVMSCKTSEKEIWNSTHTVVVVMTDIWKSGTSKRVPWKINLDPKGLKQQLQEPSDPNREAGTPGSFCPSWCHLLIAPDHHHLLFVFIFQAAIKKAEKTGCLDRIQKHFITDNEGRIDWMKYGLILSLIPENLVYYIFGRSLPSLINECSTLLSFIWQR